MNIARTIASVLLLTLVTWVGGARRAAADEGLEQPLSPEMRAIEVTDRRGDRLDAGLSFVDHEGRSVRLADFFDGQRPVAFTLINLC